MRRRALVTGANGQDGSYLADLLLSKDYEVFGLVRRHSTPAYERLAGAMQDQRFHLLQGDVTDAASVEAVLAESQPEEVYHFAAQSFVGASFASPLYTCHVIVTGTLNLLEALRKHHTAARLYHASSSEQFGNAIEIPQRESTPFKPISPYGVAKAAAHQLCVTYRQAYGLWVSCGISFNHESERRGEEFVTRKITTGLARIARGEQDQLKLGNLNAYRDWLYAPDVVHAAWMLLQADVPLDVVIASGESHSVQEFLTVALNRVGLPLTKVVIDPGLKRPTDIHHLRGDATKLRTTLHWLPTLDFTGLVHRMVDYDLYGPPTVHHHPLQTA